MEVFKIYPPYIQDKVQSLLSRMDEKKLFELGYSYKKWRLQIEKNEENIEIWFRGILLVEYNLSEKVLYENPLNSYMGGTKCWKNWVKEARVGLCKYYHIRPKRKITSSQYVHVLNRYADEHDSFSNYNIYGECEKCGSSVNMINTVDRYCPRCGRTIIENMVTKEN